MSSKYSVSLEKLLKDNQFEKLYMPKEPEDIIITSPDVNRPGLILSGFDSYFDNERVNFLGMTEIEYINSIPETERRARLEIFMSKRPALLIITRSLPCPDDLLALAEKYEVPVIASTDSTSRCMAEIIAYLNVELAERITRHGVFVEVYGEGVLILGDSGVGKSETAIELIKRGHRLIADDAVEIKKTTAKTLIGSAPDNIRHFIELRGIGIVNARRIFGMGAVKL